MSDESKNNVVAGNVYHKYTSRNPIARYLMHGFFATFDRLVAQAEATTVTEAGCGEGHLSLRLARRGKHVTASDISPAVVATATAEAAAASPPLTATFRVDSIYDLTPEVDAAELVICCEVMEHLEEPERALAVLATLAQPYLLVSVPHEPVWRMLNMIRLTYLRDWGNTPGHLQHWSRRGFLQLLRRHVDIETVASPFPWTMVLCRARG